jgi:hypothetical protein
MAFQLPSRYKHRQTCCRNCARECSSCSISKKRHAEQCRIIHNTLCAFASTLFQIGNTHSAFVRGFAGFTN